MSLFLNNRDYQLTDDCICPAGVSSRTESSVKRIAALRLSAFGLAAVFFIRVISIFIEWVSSINWTTVGRISLAVLGLIAAAGLLFLLGLELIVHAGNRIEKFRSTRKAGGGFIHRIRVNAQFRELQRVAQKHPSIYLAKLEDLQKLSGHHGDHEVSREALEAYREALEVLQANKPKDIARHKPAVVQDVYFSDLNLN